MDAVLAIQMALNLLEPESSGIGGGGFLLYYDKKKNHLTCLLYTSPSPRD